MEVKTRQEALNAAAEKKAKELGLTELQVRFCDLFVFVCGMNAEKSVEFAGYSLGNEETAKEHADKPSLAKYYRDLAIRKVARSLLTNQNVLRYIEFLKETIDTSLIVDKCWVIEKLKKLAEAGSEKTQLEATKLIGQTMNMFQPETIVSSVEDPGQIVRDAIAKRKQEEDEKPSNVVEFKKEQPNEG